jgi:hypothetical protein
MAEPTNEELMDAWHEHRRRQLGEIAENGTLHAQSPIDGKPVDPQTGKLLTYEEMKQRFLAAQGRGVGWEVPDTTEHDINVPTPQSGKLRDQNGNFISYESAREMYFSKMGRVDPAKKQQHWQHPLEHSCP